MADDLLAKALSNVIRKAHSSRVKGLPEGSLKDPDLLRSLGIIGRAPTSKKDEEDEEDKPRGS